MEHGADKFIQHTSVVARRIGVSAAVVALLTAGTEWEELGVVVAALGLSRQSLALGNVIGSSIANILGAFSLGLLFKSSLGGSEDDGETDFDRSSKIYSLLLLGLTGVVSLVLFISPEPSLIWTISGAAFLFIFGAYAVSIIWAISKGGIRPPEDNDSDSDSEASSQGSFIDTRPLLDRTPPPTRPNSVSPSPPPAPTLRHGLQYHIVHLVIGFLALSLSSYILSHAATNIVDEFGGSDYLFGIIVLSIATTLPEKFIALMAGKRGELAILVANTAGSNIFLLSLCLGIVMVDAGRWGDKYEGQGLKRIEIAVMLASSALFTGLVWCGRRLGQWSRCIGVIMVMGYIGFLVCEVFVLRKT
ncbi:uncharacterized protein BDR25DRAFT_300564 [Lindgomyces ingoldianus]|uniref:Uncharacterized protein n=1 Tax=Lindgomyces ingoldianus TaxID=673940 RepID=A0ACB6RBL2_9PLEO|nr:uncharacterized protein BDR25DRAFT_300564 [Lindgomyces ingoldianus]KAF2476634.1 hypothetical protein BDR25DRAFT_300564 [Lindgomyces ingoldianus]